MPMIDPYRPQVDPFTPFLARNDQIISVTTTILPVLVLPVSWPWHANKIMHTIASLFISTTHARTDAEGVVVVSGTTDMYPTTRVPLSADHRGLTIVSVSGGD